MFHSVILVSPWLTSGELRRLPTTSMPNLIGTLWIHEHFPGENFLLKTTVETERYEDKVARHRVKAVFEFDDENVAIQFKLANS